MSKCAHFKLNSSHSSRHPAANLVASSHISLTKLIKLKIFVHLSKCFEFEMNMSLSVTVTVSVSLLLITWHRSIRSRTPTYAQHCRTNASWRSTRLRFAPYSICVTTKFITHSQTFVTDGDSDTPGKKKAARVGVQGLRLGLGLGLRVWNLHVCPNVRTAVKVIHIFFSLFSLLASFYMCCY